MNPDPVRQVILLRDESRTMITRPLHSLTCKATKPGEYDLDCECCRFDRDAAGIENARCRFIPPFILAQEEYADEPA